MKDLATVGAIFSDEQILLSLWSFESFLTVEDHAFDLKRT